MKTYNPKAIAAAMAATIVVSMMALTSCEGRKMTNMEPTGETVEVVIDGVESVPGTDAAPETAPETAVSVPASDSTAVL